MRRMKAVPSADPCRAGRQVRTAVRRRADCGGYGKRRIEEPDAADEPGADARGTECGVGADRGGGRAAAGVRAGAHGGIISALLDELIGRAVCMEEPACWGVTVDLTIKYKKPVPLEQPLVAVGRVTRNRSRMFEGSGEIYLPDGTLLASAEGRYMKLPVDKIVESETPISDMNWRMLDVENAPEYIELPY